jgi:phage FluMu protein Com
MLTIRCKNCNQILESHSSQTKCCGCDNMTSIKGETITAIDLTKVEIVSNILRKETKQILSKEDLSFQESRKNRKIRKLEFEIR